MVEANLYQEGDEVVDYTAVAAVTGGQVVQLRDGRAGVIPDDVAAAELGAASTAGIYTVAKTIDLVWVDGMEIWWDHSANAAILRPAADKDFYLGAASGDQTAASTTGRVALNVKPTYLIDLQDDGFTTVIVKTVVGSTSVEVPDVKARGGTMAMNHGATSEAQKVDLLSSRSWATGAKWIVDGIVNVITNPATASSDFSIGVANATHASDADTITESCFLHLDGGSLVINAESDDGATEVAATSTTISLVAGTPFHFLMDGRNVADIQIYINGVLVLGSTVFVLTAATGPLKLLAHFEKAAQTDVGVINIDKLRVRIANE